MLETLVCDKLSSFIRPLLTKHQFGFLKKRSCLTQLLISLSDIHATVDSGETCSAVYLDFRKAFDSVPHDELMFKLWRQDLNGSG